ncbi:hypothetical protein LOK49_LG13G00373 [Camellia lanceoleosa]|uniref:Uncharacterized protein n=1 Tax=Camellia lanceoleosa TaxID=1840588 RepID=A0ACC0FMP2_9ERIC|nr:hypothetical protein LOK49_LG13G00373 [Camellia lanceoleosa]
MQIYTLYPSSPSLLSAPLQLRRPPSPAAASPPPPSATAAASLQISIQHRTASTFPSFNPPKHSQQQTHNHNNHNFNSNTNLHLNLPPQSSSSSSEANMVAHERIVLG